LIKELITVLDSFDLAIESLEGHDNEGEKEKYLKGIYLIKNQLEDLMKKEGLEEISVEKGKVPDLNQQEIISEIETSTVPAGTVAEIFQKGYLLNGKLIRPVRVAVAKQIKTN
jgi:molecular chaperone GrpE